MSLLEDAQRLIDWNPKTPFCECVFCDAFLGGCGVGNHGDEERPHDPDCPWLSMPRIVAVLEAAERMAAAIGKRRARWVAMTDQDYEEAEAYDALVAALRGEGVTA